MGELRAEAEVSALLQEREGAPVERLEGQGAPKTLREEQAVVAYAPEGLLRHARGRPQGEWCLPLRQVLEHPSCLELLSWLEQEERVAAE